MRDFKAEKEKLDNDLNGEILDVYKTLKKRGLEKPLTFKNMHIPNQFEIKLKHTQVVEGWYTVVNGIVTDNASMLSLKGYQVGRRRYRIKPIKYIDFEEKTVLLNYLRELI